MTTLLHENPILYKIHHILTCFLFRHSINEPACVILTLLDFFTCSLILFAFVGCDHILNWSEFDTYLKAAGLRGGGVHP